MFLLQSILLFKLHSLLLRFGHPKFCSGIPFDFSLLSFEPSYSQGLLFAVGRHPLGGNADDLDVQQPCS